MKYAVFLRGVNVGGRTVKSTELKEGFVRAGFKNAQTVLATGNVIIDSAESAENLRGQIEKFLEKEFNFEIRVCVVSAEELAAVIKNYPFENHPDFHRYVIFSDGPVGPLDFQLDETLEAVQPGTGVMYWQVQKGHTLDSDFAKRLAKAASKTFSTTRNLNTLEKIAAKL